MVTETNTSAVGDTSQNHQKISSDLLSRFGWIAVLLSVIWITWVRLSLRTLGPDLDTDSIGHTNIGRLMAVNWRDITIHWVWLPLWHTVNMVIAKLGGTLETVRLINIGLSALSPMVLTGFLRDYLQRNPSDKPWVNAAEQVIPFASAILLALWPICLNLGQSGQPEPIFQLLVMTTLWLHERKHSVLAGICLGLLSMLRYETWLLPPVFFLLWAIDRPWQWKRIGEWVIPGVVITGWIVLHHHERHEWFEFLRRNKEYIVNAYRVQYMPWAQEPRWHAPFYFTWKVPLRDASVLLRLAIPGAVWFVWRMPWSVRAVVATMLGFLTYSWARRLHLGLARHFVVFAPYYATMIAAAFCLLGSWLVKPWLKFKDTVWVVALACVVLVYQMYEINTKVAIGDLTYRLTRVYMDERKAALALPEIVGDRGIIFCDAAAVEVYSGMRYERFMRWTVTDVQLSHIEQYVRRDGHAFVVSSPEHLVHLQGHGTVRFANSRYVMMAFP